MEGSASASTTRYKNDEESSNHLNNGKKKKPPFLIAKDDTKPLLRDPLWISDPNQNEEAVLRLPPLSFAPSKPGQP